MMNQNPLVLALGLRIDEYLNGEDRNEFVYGFEERTLKYTASCRIDQNVPSF